MTGPGSTAGTERPQLALLWESEAIALLFSFDLLVLEISHARDHLTKLRQTLAGRIVLRHRDTFTKRQTMWARA
jgi:hypothetical protein